MTRRSPFTWPLLVSILFLGLGCASDSDESSQAHAHGDDDHAHTHVPRRVVPDGAGAPLFNDLGAFHREVSTDSELAQKYFDQGLVLTYGFNHLEAHRAFKEASAQDPSCAMCAWGEAYVLGPNINKPMDPADGPTAYEAAQRATKLADGATPVEQALIQALATRYADPVSRGSERTRPRVRGRDATGRCGLPGRPRRPDPVRRGADGHDALGLLRGSRDAEAASEEVIAALETVIAADPDHIGALHLYIHAIEPSSTPGRAETAADRLGPLSPGAGHLVHMPSHIYLRVGRYHDASVANEKPRPPTSPTSRSAGRRASIRPPTTPTTSTSSTHRLRSRAAATSRSRRRRSSAGT